MANSKIFLYSPIILLSTSIPLQANNTQIMSSDLINNEKNIQSDMFNDDWLIKIINKYYSDIESNISNISDDYNSINKKQLLSSKLINLIKIINSETIKREAFTKNRKMIFPIDRKNFYSYTIPITSYYGPRIVESLETVFIHEGLDIAAPPGTSVICPLPGYIIKSEDESNTNIYTVTIYHGKGLYSRWAHVNPIKLSGFVDAGEVFARIRAKSIQSTGPHIHMELIKRENGKYYIINPFSNKLPYKFTFLDNGKPITKFENYYENLRMRSGYDNFLSYGKENYKYVYGKDYIERVKNFNSFIPYYFEPMVLNEDAIENEIIKGIKNSIKQIIISKVFINQDEIMINSNAVNDFLNNIDKYITLSLDDDGGFRYQKFHFRRHLKKIFNKYYPRIMYDTFSDFFKSLNIEVFSYVIDSIASKDKKSGLINNNYIKNILLKNKTFKSILWDSYKSFANKFEKQIGKIFFLNLDFNDDLDSYRKLLLYNNEIEALINKEIFNENILIESLKNLDVKFLKIRLKKTNNFQTFINSTEFEKLINSAYRNFSIYIRKSFNKYLCRINSPKTQDITDVNLINSKMSNVCSKRKIEEQTFCLKNLDPVVKVKNNGNKILIFFESFGNIDGKQIFAVKLVKETSEKALFLIEQKNKANIDYLVLAKFKPEFISDFNSVGYFFEIPIKEKILYVKSFDEYCQMKKYLYISELEHASINITLHPIAEHNENKSKIVKRLFSPFEYSIPIEFKDNLFVY